MTTQIKIPSISEEESENMPEIILGVFLNRNKELRFFANKSYIKSFKPLEIQFQDSVNFSESEVYSFPSGSPPPKRGKK